MHAHACADLWEGKFGDFISTFFHKVRCHVVLYELSSQDLIQHPSCRLSASGHGTTGGSAYALGAHNAKETLRFSLIRIPAQCKHGQNVLHCLSST